MTNKITYLDDGEFCIIKKDEVNFFNENGKKINKKILELSSDHEQNYEKVILNTLWLKKLKNSQQL